MKKLLVIGVAFLILSGCQTGSLVKNKNNNLVVQSVNEKKQCKRVIEGYFVVIKEKDVNKLKELYTTQRREMAKNTFFGDEQYDYIKVLRVEADEMVAAEYMTFGRGNGKKIKDIKGFRTVFEYKLKENQTANQDKYKFVLIKESGKWLIDDFGY